MENTRTNASTKMIYFVKITRIDSSNQNLRTQSVSGICKNLPMPTEQFKMISKSLTKQGEIRLIETSQIKSITTNNNGSIYEFETLNSHYEIEQIQKDQCDLEGINYSKFLFLLD